MLDPVYEEKVLGHAEIRQLLKASRCRKYRRKLCIRWKIREKLSS